MKPHQSQHERRRDTAAKWQACADAGMSQSEAARHLGHSSASACLAQKRYGVIFTVKRQGRPRFDIEAMLSPPERESYRSLKRAGYLRLDALKQLRRQDIIDAIPVFERGRKCVKPMSP